MIWLIVVTVILIDSFCLQPVKPRLSHQELKRRATRRSKGAELNLARSEEYLRISVILIAFRLSLLVAGVILAIHWKGYGAGALYGSLAVLGYLLLGTLLPNWSASQWFYSLVEPWLIKLSRKLAKLTPWLKPQTQPMLLGSKADLLKALAESPQALNQADRLRVERVLSYASKQAIDIMTPWQQVVTVKKAELLGPLMLDELHKSGNSRFPVMSGESMVGLLDITQLVTLNDKRSITAGQAMGAAHKVASSALVDEVLAEFAATQQTILVVVDDQQKPVGMIQLVDTLKHLTGIDY